MPKTLLTLKQRTAAAALRDRRPDVIPGTRVIVDDAERGQWYCEINHEMKRLGINRAAKINEFCDRAGVPD